MSTSPAGRRSRPGISPSRAAEFMQCPLLFRLRLIDQIPEPPSSAATRGTLVHSVLERLYDAPAGERTLELARDLLPAEWGKLLDVSPELASLFAEDGDAKEPEPEWLAVAGRLLGTYFQLEDPNRLQPRARELWVEHQLEGGPLLRGVVDRIDVAPDGAVRVVDYKTGRSPRPGYEETPLFQMRFYGLVIWRTRAVLPKMLQLIYLGDAQILRAEPSERDLELTEQKVRSVWDAITSAASTGEFRPRRTRLCDWCAHQSLCPEFGGTPPELDPAKVQARLGVPA